MPIGSGNKTTIQSNCPCFLADKNPSLIRCKRLTHEGADWTCTTHTSSKHRPINVRVPHRSIFGVLVCHKHKQKAVLCVQASPNLMQRLQNCLLTGEPATRMHQSLALACTPSTVLLAADSKLLRIHCLHALDRDDTEG